MPVALARPIVLTNAERERLKSTAGVTVLLGGDGFTPHPPRHGNLDTYPWQTAIDALPTP
uniref:Uncharacterized protein n=1 Tax=Streptomyces sp. NBC_00003 TaxID=2903608 RepID=A0AAU2UYY4_9ACTN